MKTTQKKTNKLCLLLSMVAFSIVLLAKPMTAQAALSAPNNIKQTADSRHNDTNSVDLGCRNRCKRL